MKTNIPSQIRFVANIYLCGLLVFSAFRFTLLIFNWTTSLEVPTMTLVRAFIMGWRFDTVISGYILILPFLLFNIFSWLGVKMERPTKWLLFFVMIAYAFSFFICAADIPYFDHFLTRITTAVLAWRHDPMFMFKVVFADLYNYPFIALYIFITILFIKTLIRFRRRFLFQYSHEMTGKVNITKTKNIILSVMALGLMFFGIRGRIITKAPIQWGTAYFSNYHFANELGLNPVFTYMRSYLDYRNPENIGVHFMNDTLAIKTIQRSYGITESRFDSPIARSVQPKGNELKANVVIVLMESMSMTKLGIDGNPENMTPVLDSLSKTSYFFNNIFCSGIHPFTGIYSTLFSFPSLMNQHPLQFNDNNVQPFTGIGRSLADKDYQTIFFCTQDVEFDNMSGFLKANGYKDAIGAGDYNSKERYDPTGVPDDIMFEHAVSKLTEMHKNNKPFFASILTGSDHAPYHLPDRSKEGFNPHSGTLEKRVVEYADWSIGKFLRLAVKQEWFKNTLFVFVADHGSSFRNYYEMSLSFYRTPLIMYAPDILKKDTTVERAGGQMDIYPTIMGLLNMKYINNTLGVDLLHDKREYVCFNGNDKLGCVNDSLLWFKLMISDREYLYPYKTKQSIPLIDKYKAEADSMKLFSKAMMQITQWLIRNKKVGPQTLHP
jgi:phosphoglycerol transferase MdoB-like AlkP superfamily enzyme